jgi:hypothetical protein
MSGEAPPDLYLWKGIWDYILNNPEFRTLYTCGGDYTIAARGGSRNAITHERGTIQIKDAEYPEEEHFIAYEIKNGKMHIFDSAASEGKYGSWASLPILRRLAKRAGKNFVMIPHHPQVHEEDSFCQTWSLAWLSELRKLTENVKTGNQGIGRLYRICKTIINDPRFTEFIMKHEGDIHAYILTFMREEKIKNTSFKTPEGFLKYSHKMTPEQFRTIFED